VVLAICDADHGLVEAIGQALAGTSWQRSRTHELAGSACHGGHVASSPRVAALVRTIVDVPDRHELTAQCQRITSALAGKLAQGCHARCELQASRHFRKGTLAPALEYQPPRSACTRRSACSRLWWGSSRIEL
jgi:putative transposase